MAKREQYLKDDKAFTQFLFDWALEQTELLFDEKPLEKAAWQDTLAKLLVYDLQLSELGGDSAWPMINAIIWLRRCVLTPWIPEDGIDALLERLKRSFPNYTISSEIAPVASAEEESVDEQVKQPEVVFKQLTLTWTVPLEFFSSHELKTLMKELDTLAHIEDTMWKLQIPGKERFIMGKGTLQLTHGITAISRPYMNIQRYKGLGEMNPEQLWETSMDPKVRMLLRVKIEDALEADRWFNTLMGDDVSGRKEYIETYGHFVRNLDV